MGVGAGWYYDSLDGMVVHQNLAESLANALFDYYHGPYKTEALALAHKGVSGPPASTNESLGQQLGTATGSVLGLPQLSNLRDLMIRVIKVVIGAAMIIVGIAQLSGASKIAASLPKVVPV
jgi:hypothetical protein